MSTVPPSAKDQVALGACDQPARLVVERSVRQEIRGCGREGPGERDEEKQGGGKKAVFHVWSPWMSSVGREPAGPARIDATYGRPGARFLSRALSVLLDFSQRRLS